MGLLDHRRTWHYRVNARPTKCVEAFVAAFSGSGGVLAKARWNIEPSSDGAVATYEGRRGVIAAVTAMSSRATAEQDGALGSQITFEVESAGEQTTCSMWLSSAGSRLGFTNDGRFFRPYMRAVETELRRIDPGVQVTKD